MISKDAKKIIGLAVLTILVIFLFKKFANKLLGAIIPANAMYLGNAPIPQGWSPDNISQRLFDALDGLFTSPTVKMKLLDEFNVLNDNQIIAVYNHFKNKFWSENQETLTQAINAEWIIRGSAGDVALNNLRRLQLP